MSSDMLNQLLHEVEKAHCGLCISIEYYHVCDCVVKIWKNGACCAANKKPLIFVEDGIDNAILRSRLMLHVYLNLSDEERNRVSSISLRIEEEEYGNNEV